MGAQIIEDRTGHEWSQATLLPKGKKKFFDNGIIFLTMNFAPQANTLQTAVLLHYNDQSTYSVEQLIEYTGIEKTYMMSLLESMINLKLLKRSDQDQGPLCGTSNIEINTAYNEYVHTKKNSVSSKMLLH